jgi:hypothetical protein
VAISAESVKLSQSVRVSEPPRNTFLQRLVDEGSIYVPQAMSVPQFATLYAVLKMLMPPYSNVEASAPFAEAIDASLVGADTGARAPWSRALRLGLDELDTLARTRAGYPFAELTSELQDIVLDLIAAGTLSTKAVNLASWLEELRDSALADLAHAGHRP